MDEQFKAGDVVQLKSGGPKMTVEKTGHESMMGAQGDYAVWCVWFEGTKRKTDTFGPASLKKIEA
jgi:uncharacterized protein YodC (DUF2158 family)